MYLTKTYNIATIVKCIFIKFLQTMIFTPFTRQTSERGIIMRYSFEFKLECVEMHERGDFFQIHLMVYLQRDSEII